MNIRRFRSVQTTVSVVLFIVVFALCWHTTQFNIKNIQLSYWGVHRKLGWLWNGCISLLAISIFINVYYFIKHHTRLNDKYTKFLAGFFGLTALFLFLTGIIDMSHTLHTITAYIYFFAFPLGVFLFAHLNRKHLQYQEWQIHTTFAICMVVGPLLVINVFKGMAITETIHSIFVIGWCIWILTLD